MKITLEFKAEATWSGLVDAWLIKLTNEALGVSANFKVFEKVIEGAEDMSRDEQKPLAIAIAVQRLKAGHF